MFSKIKKRLSNKWSMALALAYGLSTQAAHAQSSITDDDCPEGTLGGIACNIRQQFGEFGALVVAGFYLVGFCLTGLGVYYFWKNEQQPNQDFGKKGAIAVIVGGGLLSITYIVDASTQSITDEEIDTGDQINADLGGEF